MIGSELCDRQPGRAIAKPALQDIAAHKGGRPRQRPAQRRTALSVPIHLLRAQRRVAFFDRAPVLSCVAHRVVKQIAFERFYARAIVHRYRFMNQSRTPAAM
ncbi:MAG: hypothetical protein DMF71_10505 [Acidobacteria bacterium]|nr:MAG: hypothetical protein DMF71_10505 [Acidobacteriota bacterium]